LDLLWEVDVKPISEKLQDFNLVIEIPKSLQKMGEGTSYSPPPPCPGNQHPPHQTLILESDHHPKSDNWCSATSDVIAHMEVGVTS